MYVCMYVCINFINSNQWANYGYIGQVCLTESNVVTNYAWLQETLTCRFSPWQCWAVVKIPFQMGQCLFWFMKI